MAWNGTHPAVTRAVARSYLPPGACRRCVYAFRIAVGDGLMARRCAGRRCSRCDVHWPADIATKPLQPYVSNPARWGA